MQYIKENNNIRLLAGGSFNIKNTFDCGQCFRWNENPDGSYTGIVRDHMLRVFEAGDDVILENCSDDDLGSIWEEYFDLGNDYDKIRDEIAMTCPAVACTLDSINGIRILSQEPWEALCSFIISQNNNIPRIKGIIDRLCRSFGDPCGSGFTFPGAGRLALLSPDDLAPLRSGFRARYIIDAAQKVASGEVSLNEMRSEPIEDCRRELMKITGVGAKVAECTLLYGLHRLEAFPIDVWMKRALSNDFSGVQVSQLGRYAGIAQQYIFHYSRRSASAVGSPA